MFAQPFYHSVIRNLVSGFGTLFSNLQIQRHDAAGVLRQTINVPIAYAPKEKWNVRVDQDPELTKHLFTTLPRMSFEITGYSYDSTRMVNRNNTIRTVDGATSKQMFAPVPYNLDISLYVLTKGTEDGLTIVEQILPLFAPEYTLNLIAIPEMDVRQDIPIILNSVTVQDDFEGDFATRRFVTHTFNFTAKVNLYGPTKTGKQILATDTRVDTVTLGAGERLHQSEGNPVGRVITKDTWGP